MPTTSAHRRVALLAGGLAVASLLLAGVAVAQHPHPQPQLTPSQQTTTGDTTTIVTGESLFAPSFPFADPPGTNLLPTVYTNVYDSSGNEMPNTLPSTPTNPYNLHDGDPVVSEIDPTSPTDDLTEIFDRLLPGSSALVYPPPTPAEAAALVQRAIDVLEGNPVPDRAYSGIPLLHYVGPEKIKPVEPIHDAAGEVVGGNVDVHQVWYDNHIESDTAQVDPTAVFDVPWTITYTVDVLSRGHDDFSPFAMYTDDPAFTDPGWRADPPGKRQPHVGMDQTFFPMEDGTRTVFKVKMTPGKYLNLVYTWGWRSHPPRIQVIENALKSFNGKTLPEWEISVFGPAPRSSEEAKLHAIAQIGDLAPAKRMWNRFRAAAAALAASDGEAARGEVAAAQEAFYDWRERTELPDGVEVDPDSDLTILFVNNTLYGEFRDGTIVRWPNWQTRGTTLRVTIVNGDYFEHAYDNVDFGGGRGWENQFKSSVRFGGSGCWFTFGRAYWWINNSAPIIVDAATRGTSDPSGYGEADTPGRHRVHVTYQFDPSRRLRFYQFDPMHHDVAIFSVH